MKISKPYYYDGFRCAASACTDSCCKEWDVQIDEESAEKYRMLPGALGDRLREVMAEDENGDTVMTILEGRCPMWRQDGLCRIQAELGHEALCRTCREFPRLTHDYGDFVELGLELSCPVAAERILHSENLPRITEEQPGGEAPEYDEEVMEILLGTRETALALLGDTSRALGETLAVFLMYGYHVQSLIDGEEEDGFDTEAALAQSREYAGKVDEKALPAFYLGLEILTDGWKTRLECCGDGPWREEQRAFAAYCVERYWLQAVSDYDLVCRVKMAVAGCLLLKKLGGDPVSTAQLYSKEIENNADNVDAILDGAYESPALTDAALLGGLLR